jgi:hypothetical protein
MGQIGSDHQVRRPAGPPQFSHLAASPPPGATSPIAVKGSMWPNGRMLQNSQLRCGTKRVSGHRELKGSRFANRYLHGVRIKNFEKGSRTLRKAGRFWCIWLGVPSTSIWF